MRVYPYFNEELFNKLIAETPTQFKTPFGVIQHRKELIKNILVDVRDIIKFNYDVFHISQGDEGSGKSSIMGEIAFIYHHFLSLFNAISHDWDLSCCYGSLDKMLEHMEEKRAIPFQFYILDEGDELAAENFMMPSHKKFRMEMRRGRKFSRLVFVNLPQAKELSSRLVTTRCQKIYDLEVDRDSKFNIVRGEYKLISIPRGRKSYSYYNDEYLPKNYIKNILSNLLKSKDDFITFPSKIISFQGSFKGVDVWNPDEYKKKMTIETSEVFKDAYGKKLTKNEERIILDIFEEIANLRLIHDIFRDKQNDRQAFYMLKKKLISNLGKQ